MGRNIKTLFLVSVALLVLSSISNRPDTGRRHQSVDLASDRFFGSPQYQN